MVDTDGRESDMKKAQYYAAIDSSKGAKYVPLDLHNRVFDVIAIPDEGGPISMGLRAGEVCISADSRLSVQPEASNTIRVFTEKEGRYDIREEDILAPIDESSALRLAELEARLLEVRMRLEKAAATSGQERGRHLDDALTILRD
jgi:hypothetical protein